MLFFWLRPHSQHPHVLLRKSNDVAHTPVYSLLGTEREDDYDSGTPAHTAARAVEAHTQGLIKREDLLSLLSNSFKFGVRSRSYLVHAVWWDDAQDLRAALEQLQPAGGCSLCSGCDEGGRRCYVC